MDRGSYVENMKWVKISNKYVKRSSSNRHLKMLNRRIEMENNFNTIALEVTKDISSNFERCKTLVNWVHDNFSWPATDYKNRTIEEVLERRSGNCREQAWVLRKLLQEVSIPTRWVREINIHPESIDRRNSSKQLIEEVGLKCSVFGYRHNDHTWIEAYISETNEWVPADPAMGLFGKDKWVETRFHINKLPHKTLATLDMIVPICIIVMDDKFLPIDNRSNHYLIDLFSQFFPHVKENTIMWEKWVTYIHSFYPYAQLAFQAEYNLHEQDKNIKEMHEVYKTFWKES